MSIDSIRSAIKSDQLHSKINHPFNSSVQSFSSRSCLSLGLHPTYKQALLEKRTFCFIIDYFIHILRQSCILYLPSPCWQPLCSQHWCSLPPQTPILLLPVPVSLRKEEMSFLTPTLSSSRTESHMTSSRLTSNGPKLYTPRDWFGETTKT